MDINSIFAKLKNVLEMGAGASLAIGNPVKVGDLSIIPVAKIAFGFGGGAGSSAGKAKKTEEGKQQDAVSTISHQDDVATLKATMEDTNSHQDDVATMKATMEGTNSHQDDVATLKATMKDTTSEANVGGGGGGGIKTDPIGIYAIHGDKVKFYPVISIKEIATLAGLILLFSYRFARLRWRKK